MLNSDEIQNNNFNELKKSYKHIVDEYNALSRNYDALCLKLKESKNLISRLEDELKLSINKNIKDELEKELKNYKEKYNLLADSINILETKLKIATNNVIKYQENEVNYKNKIKNLEERIRKSDKLETSNKNLKQKNEQNISMLIQENKKLENENIKLLNLNQELDLKTKKINDSYEEMKKENEIIYKLLEETRKKLKDNQLLIEQINKKYENKQKNSEDLKYKQLYNELSNNFNKLKNENEILKNDNDFYKNLNNSNKSDLYKLFKIEKNINFEFIYNKKTLSFKIDKTINKYINIDEIMKNYEIKIKNKLNNFEEKHQKFLSNLIDLLTANKNKNINLNINSENLIKELNNNILKIKLENSDLKSKIKNKENEIEKNSIEIINLSNELKNLKEKLILKEKNSIDLTEIKKLFNYINDIINRLKLTMESIAIQMKCKNCYEIKNKLFQLPCGHSICEDCLANENTCIECEKNFDKNQTKENLFFNLIISRYKYAEQQINSDIDLMIKTLDEYLSK